MLLYCKVRLLLLIWLRAVSCFSKLLPGNENRCMFKVRAASCRFLLWVWRQTLAEQAKRASTASNTSVHPALAPDPGLVQTPPGACREGFAVYTVIVRLQHCLRGSEDEWMDWLDCWSPPRYFSLVKPIYFCFVLKICAPEIEVNEKVDKLHALIHTISNGTTDENYKKYVFFMTFWVLWVYPGSPFNPLFPTNHCHPSLQA